jgi:hypothetical protein
LFLGWRLNIWKSSYGWREGVYSMPFKQVEIKEKIEEKASNNAEFKAAWENSKNENQLLHNIAETRKEMEITQNEHAVISKSIQQEFPN